MYLLSGQSLATADWFRPESMALNLEERKSTATITVGPEAPAIQVGAWLRDDQEPGNGIIWRVKSTETQFNTNTRTIQLEHVVNTLRDGVMFGEVTPKTITGVSSAIRCTAKQAIQYILGRQSIWTLGTFDSAYDSVENPYNFNGDGLFAALETVTASLDDAHWEYDLSSLPFKLNILGSSSDIDSEMRMSRNIRTIRRTVDRSRMFTRLYPIGENNLHIDGDYVGQNEATYGTICKIETASNKKDKAELWRWALERLKNHCEPTVTVTVDGLDLSLDTGEPLDRLTICRKCRVPLPEFGTMITERITKLSWSDKIREPKKVAVTLANNREDIASIINKQNAKNSAGARTNAKKDGEDHAWIDDTTEHVQLVAEAIIGQGPDGVDWSRVATLGVDGTGIHGRVVRAEGYMVTLAANLDMTEERLTIAFENVIASTRSEFAMTAESLRIGFENGLASTRSEFLMTSESLRIQFTNDIASTRSEFQMTAESLRTTFESDVGSVRSQITQTANTISAVVSGTGSNALIKPAAIQASINAATGQSKIELSADHIILDGDVLANTLAAINQVGTNVEIKNLKVTGSMLYEFASGPSTTESVGFSTVIRDVQVVSTGTNSYKIQVKKAGSTQWSDLDNGSFNKAAPMSGSWGGTNNTFPLTVTDGVDNYTIGIGGSYGAHDVELELVLNGGASKNSAGIIDVPLAINQLQSGQTQPVNRYSKTIPVAVSSLLETKTVTTNGDVTPGSGYIGLGKVTVNVNNSTEVGHFNANGTYVPSAGKIGFNSVVVNVNTSTETGSFSANGTYTPSSGKIGFSSVTVNVPGLWLYTQSSRPSNVPDGMWWELSGGTWYYLSTSRNGVAAQNQAWYCKPYPSGTVESGNIQIDTYEYKSSQPSGTQAQNMWNSIKNGWNDPTMKYWRFRVYVQNPSNTSQILASKYYWFQYT